MNKLIKTLGALTLSLAMVATMCPYTPSKVKASNPGEVIVMFKDDAVKESKTSLKSARGMDNVSDDFGKMAHSYNEQGEVAKDAKSEVNIIDDSISDFELEDSITFEGEDRELTVALVKSDTLSDKELISELSDNKKIEAVEENKELELEDYEDFSDYALNDEYSGYLYHSNAPAAHNTAGDSVDARGAADPTKSISTNVATAWKDVNPDADETVIALIDTGINDTHEDLKNRLWTNPGNIGLKGEHGYNFADDNENITDYVGHGSHCAGIIAAQANNAKGVAGMAGDANVKIMTLNTNGENYEEAMDGTKWYVAMGAFSYVLKAKQAGVNVVATSNSWGRPDSCSTVYDAILDLVGEAGIVSFMAAGNANKDLDKHTDNPASTESDYVVTVGAGNIDGKPQGFSNYGKSNVDIFAPGVNILSTVGYPCYFPGLYSKDKKADTTEYYGCFKTDTPISGQTVIPETDGIPGMKAFGSPKFIISEQAEREGQRAPSVEYAIDENHRFTHGENNASLKVTIKDAMAGDDFFLYFPYETNPQTTGDDNTCFSIYYQGGDNDDFHSAKVTGGEVVNDNGNCKLYGKDGGESKQGKPSYNPGGHDLNAKNNRLDTHIFSGEEHSKNVVMPYDEITDEETGIGLEIYPTSEDSPMGSWAPGDVHDLEFYIDTIGVSKPNTTISKTEAYDMMSGTSMACPSASGTCALIAALNPQKDGQSGADYAKAIKSKFLSCARRTDELSDLCSTGGYVDLRLYNAKHPEISDAVCDVDKETITISGSNFDPTMTVKYKRLAKDGAGYVELPDQGMTYDFAPDGKSITIKNAKPLFGTYTEFNVGNSEDNYGKRSFFLVKGFNKYEEVFRETYKHIEELDYAELPTRYRHIFTDANGSKVYGIEVYTGRVSYFNGDEFVDFSNTYLKDAFFDKLRKDGYNDYELANNTQYYLSGLYKPMNDGDYVYQTFTANFDDGVEEHYWDKKFIARMKVTDKKPKWDIFEYTVPEGPLMYDYLSYTFLNGEMYIYAGELSGDSEGEQEFYKFIPDKNEWTKLQAPDKNVINPTLATFNGKIYMMFGGVLGDKRVRSEDKINNDVYCYEGGTWKKTGDLAFIGKQILDDNFAQYYKCAGLTKNGLLFMDTSVDGGGNTFIYNPETNQTTPIYYTINDGLCDDIVEKRASITQTKDGIYYMRTNNGEVRTGNTMYRLGVELGLYDSIYPEVKPTPTPTPTPKVTKPGKAKVKKIAKRKKTAKKLKITLKKVSGAKGYQVKVSKKKNSKVLVKKFVKKTKFTIKSKKFKGKKVLYVKARAYKLNGKAKVYGAWSKAKKSKAKK